MTSKNLYDLLEVSPNATQEEIKESYRLIVSMLHPDKFPQGNKQWVRATEKTKEVNEAYGVLKDPVQRAQYDGELFQQAPDAPPEQSQTFTSRTSHPASSPEASQPAPSPSTSQPEAHVQATQHDNSSDGCLRLICGLLGIICFVPVIESVTSGASSGLPTWANFLAGTVFVITGLTFLSVALSRRKKS